ncbi:MAG: endonuclease MutS2, partial [Anaerolineae bacterium]
STFSSHMTNIIGILDSATERSLVLLDELGAGTDPAEGAALAAALLDHLREREVAVIASTHYSELKAYAHATDGVRNASVEFDAATLRPTFELTIGLPGRSNALAIAERLGLPGAIVTQARGGLDTSDVVMEDMLAEIRDARRDAIDDRAAAAESRRQADEWAGKLETAVHDVQTERSGIIAAARRQAETELEAAREAIARIERRARSDEATAAAIAAAASSLDKVAAALEEVAEPEPEPLPPPESIRPGARVRVISVNQPGELIRLVGDQAEVQLGRMRLTVPITDLEALPDAPEAGPVSEAGVRLSRAEASEQTGIEVDLRGMRVEEGLDRLDHFLDQALLSGAPWVRIIHGRGTGAMRSAVRDMLRHQPHVVRSRTGEQGEGGDGVTIAYFE